MQKKVKFKIVKKFLLVDSRQVSDGEGYCDAGDGGEAHDAGGHLHL